MREHVAALNARHTAREQQLKDTPEDRLRAIVNDLGMRGIPMRKPEMIRQIMRKEFPAR